LINLRADRQVLFAQRQVLGELDKVKVRRQSPGVLLGKDQRQVQQR
jgi:hypothetical protein